MPMIDPLDFQLMVIHRLDAIEERLNMRDVRLGPKEKDYAELDAARDDLIKKITEAKRAVLPIIERER